MSDLVSISNVNFFLVNSSAVTGTPLPATTSIPVHVEKTTTKTTIPPVGSTASIVTSDALENLKETTSTGTFQVISNLAAESALKDILTQVPATDVRYEVDKVIIERPTIIKETVKPITIHVIQPEVTRIIEKTEVQHIKETEHVSETLNPDVQATSIQALEKPTVVVGPT